MFLFFSCFVAITSVCTAQQPSNDGSNTQHQVKKRFEIEKDNHGNQFIVSSIQIIQSQENNDNPSHVDRTIQKTHARTLQSLPSSLDQNEKRQILDAHNEIRKKTAQGKMQSHLPTASNMVSKNNALPPQNILFFCLCGPCVRATQKELKCAVHNT